MNDLKAQFAEEVKDGSSFVTASLSLPFGELNLPFVFEELKKLFGGPASFFQTRVDFETSGDKPHGLGEGHASPSHAPAITYMGFDCFEKIEITHGVARVVRDKKVVALRGEPIAAISQHMLQYQSDRAGATFFSRGGAMGYFGFESVRYFEPKLQQHAGSFKLADENKNLIDAELYLFKKILIFNHQSSQVLVVAGAPVTNNRSATQEEMSAVTESLRRLVGLLNEMNHGKKVSVGDAKGRQVAACYPMAEVVAVDDLQCAMGRERYVASVVKLKEHITAGDIFQAVLSERFQKKINFKASLLFNTLYETSPSAYQFYFDLGQRFLLGASPEMFLSVKNRVLETHPIAGTRPRGSTADEERAFEIELAQNIKENAEHLMLVDLARNDLGRISTPGQVKVGAASEIKKFPGVMHLVTKVFGELKAGKSALEALASCFPAGTLSGAPKIRALQLLSEIECLPREFYGGAVGLLSFDGDLEFCIAIRCAEIVDDQITFRAGAGIVADSEPQAEYEEVLHKTRSLRMAIAVAEKVAGTR